MKPQKITIKTVLNGWIVKVGCQTVVFDSFEDRVGALCAYMNDPAVTEKNFMSNAVYKQDKSVPVDGRDVLERAIPGIVSAAALREMSAPRHPAGMRVPGMDTLNGVPLTLGGVALADTDGNVEQLRNIGDTRRYKLTPADGPLLVELNDTPICIVQADGSVTMLEDDEEQDND